MKRLVNHTSIFVLFLLMSQVCLSQPVLTASNSNAVIGDTVMYYTLTNVDPGPAGSHVVWDFSSISSGNKDTSYFAACVYSGLCSVDSGSIVLYRGGPQHNVSIFQDATQKSQTQYYFGDQITRAFDSHHTLIHYPFTFNDTYVDSFVSSSVIFVPPHYEHLQMGLDTLRCDGYGTLILPAGDTIFDALRIHDTRHYYDTAYEDSKSVIFPGKVYTQEIYTWMSPTASHYYLLQITQPALSLGVQPLNTDFKFRILNNPAHNVINAEISLRAGGNMHLLLTDMLGRICYTIEKDAKSGTTPLQIPVSTLPKGIYTISLQTGTNVAVSRVVID